MSNAVTMKWGYIDKPGNVIISPEYLYAFEFCDGIACVAIGTSETNRKFGYIDSSGRTIVSPQFMHAGGLSEGLAAVFGSNGKWGFIDKSGKFVIEPKFDRVYPQHSRAPYIPKIVVGLAAVAINKKIGFINNNDEFVIEPQFDGAIFFQERMAAVQVEDKWGFISK